MNSPAAKYSTETARWLAVTSKDKSADGSFVYSVRTTGVYCRPSCSSRPALRRNVAFHDSPEDAEQAGFRACKRCQPNGHSLADEHGAAIARSCRVIEAADQAPGLSELAKVAGMSRFHFHRVFKAITGVTPKAYANVHRATRARTGLRKSRTVTEAIYDAGFNSSSRFYANSSETLGMKPKAFLNGGSNTTIRFAFGQSVLGSVLVASTNVGVCAILLGDGPEALMNGLRNQFPKADLVKADKDFERIVVQVIGLIEFPSQSSDLPMDIRGTAFQRKVWEALRKIPAGSTLSYSQLAERIGVPKAVRAVAGACASNRLAVVIPCHRVLRNDGSISGYRWGAERKKKLLQREREQKVS